MDRTYRLLLNSSIPVYQDRDGYLTFDLWALDLCAQVRVCAEVRLLCPVVTSRPVDWASVGKVPESISVVDSAGLNRGTAEELVAASDVVQVPSGQTWKNSRLQRLLISAARRRGVKSVVGISSNRARTVLLNSRPRSLASSLTALRGLLTSLSIQASYRTLTALADGTFIVGEGLLPLVSPRCGSLHVGTASWVSTNERTAGALDAMRLRRVCIAARLERMKGVHVGVKALGRLAAANHDFSACIYGQGPELGALVQQAVMEGISERVQFRGVLAYPQPFLAAIAQHGLVLLTNLNDEQPRLLFDAISQGALPLCPNQRAYRALGIPAMLTYDVGDSESLAKTIETIWKLPLDEACALHEELLGMASDHTLESMHAKRASWIRTQVIGA